MNKLKIDLPYLKTVAFLIVAILFIWIGVDVYQWYYGFMDWSQFG